jgi:glycosyltransferase involved in cell wall biosynthesis
MEAHETPAPLRGPTELELRLPEHDVSAPELSIVVPALNEELTVGDFVAWCQQGLKAARVEGEILIVDSSTDRTGERALAAGARVLKTPKRGLGRAYLDALPHVRGRYVVMGDADCTYDFRELAPFVAALRAGFELVMGSRFAGFIEPGAMPALHRYFGTPLTTWVLNRLYGSAFSDIHCGLRGISREALVRMRLRSQSWEYASEMVLKSVRLGLRTTEVPVRFLKDREGRLSHHKRAGWFSPWQAGWINLWAMLVYRADAFLLWPGALLLAAGLAFQLAAAPLGLLGVTCASVGLLASFAGVLAKVVCDETGAARRRWLKTFASTRTVVLGALAALSGAGLIGFGQVAAEPWPSALVRAGLFALVAGVSAGPFTLLLHAIAWTRGDPDELA